MTDPPTPPNAVAPPGAEASCTTCGAAMKAGESKCEMCGTTRGEQHKCPFCRVVAEAEPDPVMRFRCPACGGPRIPNAVPPAATGDAVEHLKKARGARASQLAWKTSAAVAAGFGVVGLLIMTGVFAIVSPPLVPMIAGYVLCSIPFAYAALGFKSQGARTAEIKRELDEAWFLSARDMVKRKGILRAADLASAMRIEPAAAESIMVRLASLDELRPDVTDSGDLAVSMRGRVRIADAEPQPADAEPAEQLSSQEAERKGKAGV